MVFIVTVGEIDLSFAPVMALAAWMFALGVQVGYDPFLCFAAGVAVGVIIGVVVVYGGLSSLVATLGLSFLIRGAILIATGGKSIAVVALKDTAAYQVLSSTVAGFPVRMVWAVLFVPISVFLYTGHKFGAREHCVSDNPDSAAQMGIHTKRIRVYAYCIQWLGGRSCGHTLQNDQLHQVADDWGLLPASNAGGTIGAVIASFIQVGIVSAGLHGFHVQFFNGLIIILALLGHRWNQIRYR